MPITVDIPEKRNPEGDIIRPAATAYLRDIAGGESLTVAGRRAVQVTLGRLNRTTVRAIVLAGSVKEQADAADRFAAQVAADAAMAELSDDEYARILALPDATIYALLQSWTLPEPLPASPTAVGQLPIDVYDPLYAEVERRQVDVVDETDQFGVGAVEDPHSPTGASGASNERSATEATPLEPSEPKSLPGSPNTSTGGPSPA